MKQTGSPAVRIDHIQIAAPEGCESAAREFYGSFLRLRELEKPPLLRARGGCWFLCGQQQLHIGLERNFLPSRKAHVALAVSGWAALRENLIARGRPVIDDDSLPGTRRFYTEDPWGNRIELIEQRGQNDTTPSGTESTSQKTIWSATRHRSGAVRLLAIPGSLRVASSNTMLLRAGAALAPENIEVIVYSALAGLPHFNPDLDTDSPPEAVAEFRSLVRESDGVLISSPEYAHGIPGALKNALDWLVGGTEAYGKPVALFHASPRGTYAQAALTETLTVMGAKLVPAASITVPLAGTKLDGASIVSDPNIADVIRAALIRFANAIRIDSPGQS
jgi:NAD(P)H-dependent FMN reductase